MKQQNNKQHTNQRRKNVWIHAAAGTGLLLGAALATASEGTSADVAAAAAPDAAAAAPARETIGDAIPSVTVTATRRSASLQSVPVAVSVVDGEQLERSNRTGIDTVVQQIPSATFRQQGGNKDSTIFVRGVGTISTSPGVEPTVSTVVDGVVFARPGQATLDLLDIERIEVLRGPQGTLFGKNASSGVINVISRAPAAAPGGFVDVSVYQGDEKRVRAGVNGSVVPGLVKASLVASWADYAGNVDNVHAGGGKVNGYERKGVRARVDITPNADTDISLIADYLKAEASPTSVGYQQSLAAYAQALAPVVAGPENRQINADIEPAIQDANKGLSAQVNWRNNGYTFTSISAVRDWNNTQHTSPNAVGNSAELARVTAAYPGSRDVGTLDFQQASQELRVASPRGQWFDYVAGLYYLHGKDHEIYQRTVTTASSVNSGRADYGVTNDSYAAFGEGTVNLAQDWRAILGARWTRDELSYFHARTSTQATAFAGVQPGTASSGDTARNGWSGRLGLQHDLAPTASVYATYSRGYKGPAYNVFFNMLPRDTIALDPETSNSFEIGLKSSAFNRRLTFNLAAFHTAYDNYQVNFYDTVEGAVVSRLINAGKVSTRGVEADIVARPIPQLTLNASLAYIDAHIDEFKCPAAAAASCSLNGETLPFSPKFKSYLRANYAVPLPNGLQADFSADYTYQTKTQYDLFQSPLAIQGAYGIVNAAVELSSGEGGWRVALVGKNLTDRSYATFLGASTGYVSRTVPRDDQRYFGITARKEF
jgi:iron complex outermembrane receptor protein